MEKKTKKELILEAALSLFAEKGYDGVGIDEIADAVGMKGPALYHYFKGKEALFDALLDLMTEHYEAGFRTSRGMSEPPRSIPAFMELSMKRLEFTIHDPLIRQARRILAMEQFRNQKVRELTTLHHITGLESMHRGIFGGMMEAGLLKPEDPEILAMEFTAPITLMIHRIDREPEREEECMDRIRRHMEHFFKIYGK